jgi:hypothetical protein
MLDAGLGFFAEHQDHSDLKIPISFQDISPDVGRARALRHRQGWSNSPNGDCGLSAACPRRSPRPPRRDAPGSIRRAGVPSNQEARSGFFVRGAVMADKSPRQHLSKKAGKSLKEKRAEKHLKAEAKNTTQIVPPSKRH